MGAARACCWGRWAPRRRSARRCWTRLGASGAWVWLVSWRVDCRLKTCHIILTHDPSSIINRELYLSESLQRLRRPVEQMFPQVEGYQAAMPSKHDLQAFCRAVQTELLGGLAEGGPLLLPHLAKGVANAVALFCGKVEGMMKTGEGARKLYPLRGWVLSPEKEHNLQLLQLVAFLHQALRRLPKDPASTSLDRGLMAGASVGAGALGDRELERACAALEALAVGGFIQPYLADIANELGGVRLD